MKTEERCGFETCAETLGALFYLVFYASAIGAENRGLVL